MPARNASPPNASIAGSRNVNNVGERKPEHNTTSHGYSGKYLTGCP